jgi:hypothetical protein
VGSDVDDTSTVRNAHPSIFSLSSTAQGECVVPSSHPPGQSSLAVLTVNGLSMLEYQMLIRASERVTDKGAVNCFCQRGELGMGVAADGGHKGRRGWIEGEGER